MLTKKYCYEVETNCIFFNVYSKTKIFEQSKVPIPICRLKAAPAPPAPVAPSAPPASPASIGEAQAYILIYPHLLQTKVVSD